MAVLNPSLSLFLAVLLVGLASIGYGASGLQISPDDASSSGTHIEEPELNDLAHWYKDNHELENTIKAFQRHTGGGGISRTYRIGKSVLRVPQWLMGISNNSGKEEAKPADKASFFVDGMNLNNLPSMNPDGFSLRRRGTANYIDLNRDIPNQLPRSTMAVSNPSLSLFLVALLVGVASIGYVVSGFKIPTYAALSSGTHIQELNALAHQYKDNNELENAIKEFHDKRVNISSIYSIGKSVNGVKLPVIEISNNPGEEEAKPAFKFIGNMHGDEPVGRELLLRLANWLGDNYMKDPLATFIVDNVKLHILLSMNPDGFKKGTRNNENKKDLNRDFPDQFKDSNEALKERQPETRAVMEWSKEKRFTASASIHGGLLVASYPWDGTWNGKKRYHGCPDDELFKYLAKSYSHSNPSMRGSERFKQGITNGAECFHIYGGMQDWNYKKADCFELTLELSDNKKPPAHELDEIWELNRKSLLDLVASAAKLGVHGRIFSSDCGKPLPAYISVKRINDTSEVPGRISSSDGREPLPAPIIVSGKDKKIQASKRFGDYHRLLVPGHQYEVTATMSGYKTQTKTIETSTEGPVTLDFALEPNTSQDNCSSNILAFLASVFISILVGASFNHLGFTK